jgi:hypothetical protein
MVPESGLPMVCGAMLCASNKEEQWFVELEKKWQRCISELNKKSLAV